jgi:hypothetical protein
MIRHPCPFVFGEKLSECPPLGAFASTINNADAFFIEAFTLDVMFSFVKSLLAEYVTR